MTEADPASPGDGQRAGNSGLRGQASAAVRWSFAGVFGKQGIRFIFVLVLARILGPHEFGTTAEALTVITFISLFLDQGIGATLIQKAQATPALIGSATWLNFAATLVCAVVTFAAAPLVASFFGASQLTGLVRALSLDVIVLGFDVIPRALLSRRLRFRRVAMAELIGAVIGGTVGLLAALGGSGPWSLIIQVIATDALVTVVLLLGGERQFFRATRQGIREVLGFSLRVLGANLTTYGARNLDNVLVGKFLGATPLAFYSLAYRTLMVPVLGLGFVANRVALPVYAKLQFERARLARGFIEGIRLISLVSFPMMTLIIVEAPKATEVVLGSAWEPAVLPMQILALTGLRQAVQSTLNPGLLAVGRADLALRWSAGSSALYILSFIVGLHWGIVGVAVAYTAVGYALSPVSVWLLSAVLGFRQRTYYQALLPATVGSAILAMTSYLSSRGLAAAGVSGILTICISAIVGVVTFVVILRLRWHADLKVGYALVRST